VTIQLAALGLAAACATTLFADSQLPGRKSIHCSRSVVARMRSHDRTVTKNDRARATVVNS